MLSHSAVLRLWLELTLQSLSPVLARYDPFGVNVPLNFDNTNTKYVYLKNQEEYLTKKKSNDCEDRKCFEFVTLN